MKEIDVVVIGAGPGGLSCAYFLAEANFEVLVLEQSSSVGGLMRNIKYKDYCVDLAGC